MKSKAQILKEIKFIRTKKSEMDEQDLSEFDVLDKYSLLGYYHALLWVSNQAKPMYGLEGR